MSAATMNQDALDTLTPEEREAIEGAEHSPEELESMKRLAAGDDDEDDGDEADEDNGEDEDGEGEGAPVEGKGAAPAADDVGAAAPSAEQAAPAVTASAVPAQGLVAVTYTAALPADYQEQVDGLAEAESQVWAKFEAGDIDQADLQRQLREAAVKRAELESARLKAEIAQEMRVQNEQANFRVTVQTFADQVQAQVDYRKDTGKQADLDLFMKRLAQDDANADKDVEWFLAEAHKRVLALHGIAPAAVKPGADPAKAASAARKPPVASAPATLAQVPGSDGPGDLAGEFVHLDALEGEELEAAIARMSPAQRQKFAQGR